MNKHDITRDYCMLEGPLAKLGYDWWWHSFTGHDAETGEPRTFYVEYFLCNPAEAKAEPVLIWDKPQLRAEGALPSYLMVNVGTWGKDKAQLHRFFPWHEVSIPLHEPLNLHAGDCVCTETRIAGSVAVSPEEAAAHPDRMTDAGSMSWDLAVDKQIAFNVGYGASPLFRKADAFQMFWHAEGMKTQYSGEVAYDGRRYVVSPETCFGYADKNWGKDFTSPWIWLSSWNLTSNLTGKKLENSVFDIGGGQPRVYGVSLGRQLLGAFYYEGKNYEFNFSKLWTVCRTQFDCQVTEDLVAWNITMTTLSAKLELEIYCDKPNMLCINYEAPNGTKRYNHLWNCGMGYGVVRLWERDKKAPGGWRLVDEMLADNIGCEYGVYDD